MFTLRLRRTLASGSKAATEAETRRETITNDVQSRRGGNRRRSVDESHALEPLSVMVRLGGERRRRQTTDDVESSQTSAARHRHVSTERKLTGQLHTTAM